VSGIYPHRNEIILYGGAIHLSKDYLENNGKYYGLVVEYNADGWSGPVDNTVLTSLSQEHGTIRTTSDFLDRVKHGDLLGILPVHSCLTANLLQKNMKII
jgi:D-serine deaminase-like pyridoxal phosphate-dependent protein